ncbi:hypothetical protein IMZ48_33030, partial [Candidatus Bathyarchaeota archaeon]|nr:hypothetical protein [Candidatus Bathyarchaeota archaeon]
SFEYRAGPMNQPTQFSPLEAQLALVEFVPRLKSLIFDLNGAESRHLTLGVTNWVLSSLAGLKELRTLEVDTRCLVPHANPMVWVYQTRWEWDMPPELEPAVESGPVPPVSDGALVELLPESICELKIVQGSHGPGPEGLEVAFGVLATEAGRFPSLREVRMEVRVEDGWDGENGVRMAFEVRGVRFVVDAMAELPLD